MKEVDRVNKDEEARVARENRERLEKVKKENKRRAERMRNENEIRMVVVLQKNLLLEDKLVAKLQEQEQARRASNPIIGEKTAPECPVSRKPIHIHMGEISQGVQSMKIMSYFLFFWPLFRQFRGLESQKMKYFLKIY